MFTSSQEAQEEEDAASCRYANANVFGRCIVFRCTDITVSRPATHTPVFQPATRVINTLLRLVHGGSEGWHTQSTGAHSTGAHSTGACPKHLELEITDKIPHVSSTRKSQGHSKKNEDYWKWEGEETLITKRRDGTISYHRIAKIVLVTQGLSLMKGKLN